MQAILCGFSKVLKGALCDRRDFFVNLDAWDCPGSHNEVFVVLVNNRNYLEIDIVLDTLFGKRWIPLSDLKGQLWRIIHPR